MATEQAKTKVVQRLYNDPVYFIEKAIGSPLWAIQQDIVRAVEDSPKVTVKSCHGSGKTYVAARVVHRFLQKNRSSIVVTTAPTFQQVRDALWKEIKSAYNNSRIYLPGEMLDVRYKIADDWYAIGRATDQPSNFQGYHAKSILVVVDEADGVNREIYEAIEGIISSGNSRLLLIGNPVDPTSYFAHSHSLETFTKLTISCFDTPNFAPFQNIEQLMNATEEERKRAVVMPQLIQPQWAYERAMEWGIESPLFQSRVLGKFPQSSEDSLIALHLIERAIKDWGAGVSGSGEEEVIGLDVARFGSDRTAFVYRKGNKVQEIVSHIKEDTMQTAGRAIDWLRRYPAAKINIDEIGVGGGVVDRLKETEYADRVYGINVAEKAPEDYDNTIRFVNLRAKIHWDLRTRFMSNDILLPEIGTIISDLTNIKYKYRSDGAILIESKEEIKKRIGRSPDLADALGLAFYNPKSFTAEDDFAIV